MVLKSDIAAVYATQQKALQPKGMFIGRDYLSKFKPQGKHIEVISGIRRCGKSTLMRLLMQQYKKKVAYFNFEDSRIHNFELSDFQKLDELIGKREVTYFFDEIQNVPAWEIFVRQLHDRGEKVFITGSNASLLSKELGTRLTGRHIRHELFPFSYKEFLSYSKLKNSEAAFEEYIEKGGFPEFLKDENPEILQQLLKDIVLRDIAIRYGIKNSKTVMEITLFLISNIGKECTYSSLQKKFSVGSANSISNYLTWLEDTYVLFFLPKFSWSARSTAINARKVYCIDTGMVKANSMSFSKDKGRLLENLAFLYLRQQNYKLYYFKEKGECDFVVFEGGKCKLLLQACEELHGDNKNREINGLVEAIRFFKMTEGIILTKNQKDEIKVDKLLIRLVPAHEFFV